MGAANGIFGIEPMLLRPPAPDAGDGRRRIHEHSVQVKQNAFTRDFCHPYMIDRFFTARNSVCLLRGTRPRFCGKRRFSRTLSLGVTSSEGPMTKPLQIMKFGGTSVGDAACIARAAQI